MIRITGGRFRGQQIQCPKGKDIRPTTSFVRESLFNILSHQVIDARFLDLFAGCGIVGIEALSRGAISSTAVEQKPAHCRLLEDNREKLLLSAQDYTVICQDAFQWFKQLPATTAADSQFDLIFMDPPYTLPGVLAIAKACFMHQLLSPAGTFIWETALTTPPDLPMAVCVDQRRYGASQLFFFKYQSQLES